MISGFECRGIVQTGLMACVKDSYYINKLYDYYKDRHFVNSAGELDQTPNSAILADILRKDDVVLENTKVIMPNIVLYPSDYFCPINQATWEIKPTNNTYCIHYLSGSWLPFKARFLRLCKSVVGRLFGFKMVEYLRKFKM